MTSLEAFDLFVRCLETEDAQPVLAEAKSLQILVKRWSEHDKSTGRHRGSSVRNPPLGPRYQGQSGACRVAAIRLNSRERQILALLDEGLSNMQIARRCFITEGTVKWYLHSLFVKFSVGNRTALLRVVRGTSIKFPDSSIEGA